jgi:hypothetical protein
MVSLNLATARYVSLINDPVYEELSAMLKAMPELRHKTEMEQADILQEVFGLTCDVDEDGSEFKLGAPRKCPECGSREMVAWDVAAEPKIQDVPEITHNRWKSLGGAEKLDRVRARLKQIGI